MTVAAKSAVAEKGDPPSFGRFKKTVDKKILAAMFGDTLKIRGT